MLDHVVGTYMRHSCSNNHVNWLSVASDWNRSDYGKYISCHETRTGTKHTPSPIIQSLNFLPWRSIAILTSDMQSCVKLQGGSSELLHQLERDLFTGGNSWAKFNNRKAKQMKSTHLCLSYHPTATLLFFLHLPTVVKSVLESCRNADKKKFNNFHII